MMLQEPRMIWTSRGQILRTMRPTRAPTPFTVNKVNRRALQFHLKNRIRITVLWIWVDKFRILRKLYEQKIYKSKDFLFQTIFIWDFDAIKYYLIKIQEFFSSRYWVAVFSGDLTVCTVSIQVVIFLGGEEDLEDSEEAPVIRDTRLSTTKN